MSAASVRWADLKPRVISAAAMLVVGAVEIWLGGLPFLALVTLLTAAMIWELARMTGPVAGFGPSWMPMALGALAAGMMVLDEAPHDGINAWLLMPLMGLALLATPRLHPVATALIGLAIMVAGHGLFVLRDEEGSAAFIWLLSIVIVSDISGYFVGRLLGGPKFWPAISPKKTWSGTIAGWIGAALVGFAFLLAGHGGWQLVIFSPLLAFAGQMGDIAESWIKRRTGVKDSSNLIPGHGGVMDRFDALTGAMVAVMLLTRFVDLPIGG